MNPASPSSIELTSPELLQLRMNKLDGYNYRFRREEDWRENYTYYRGIVILNRLTQRQSVHLPLMKAQIRTLLAEIDDMPVIQYENLSNDKQAELFMNDYWKYTIDMNKMELKDIVDKKQDMMFGRTYDQMQIIDGMVRINIVDPEDILMPRYMDTTNINSGRYLIHTHIFRAMSAVEQEKDYDKVAIANLKLFYATNQGLIKAKTNAQLFALKAQKLADMGVLDAYSPALGETYLELSMHFVFKESEKDKDGVEYKNQFWLYVEADDMQMLMKKPLEQVIGVTKDHYWRTHLPYNSWSDDIDNQDWYTDGIADIVRGANKILDAFYSQLVENRSLKNLNMMFYDATNQAFVPQTYEPKTWGMYGTPGKPSDIMMPVPVGDLQDSLKEMDYIQEMIEKATAATATQQGQETENSITLGEVQLALQQAKERIKGMSKFYTQVWIERGQKFLKLVEAGGDKLDAVRIYKKGRNTDKIYSREIDSSDWESALGYGVKVWDQDDKNTQDTQKLQKLNAAVMNMPGNQTLLDIYDRDLLEFCDLKPDQIQAVMDTQKEMRQQQMQQMQAGMMGGQPQPGQPMQPGAQPQPGQMPTPPLQLGAGQPAKPM